MTRTTPMVSTAMLAMLALLLLPACDKKKRGDRSGGGTGSGSSWIVGEQGMMFRLAPLASSVSGYDWDVELDLLDIACLGQQMAWVAGEGGVLLRTVDGGDAWEFLDAETTGTMTAVAVSAAEVVYAAGERALLVSSDAGDSWSRVRGADARFTDVATTHHGRVALATADDGAIYRYDQPAGTLARVREPDGTALHGIALTPDGAAAMAVGAHGAMLYSHDGGWTWRALDVPEAPSLYAVRLASTGDLAVAVGDGGAVARWNGGAVHTARAGGVGGALRALHLSADGTGLAVGDDGVVLATGDGGASWRLLDLEIEGTLFGVDDLGGGPHL